MLLPHKSNGAAYAHAYLISVVFNLTTAATCFLLTRWYYTTLEARQMLRFLQYTYTPHVCMLALLKTCSLEEN